MSDDTPLEPQLQAVFPIPSDIIDVYIDRTSLDLYWQCPRKFWWARRYAWPDSDVLGVEAISDEAKVFGKVMHLAVEQAFGVDGASYTTGAALGSTVMAQLLDLITPLQPHLQKEYTGLLYGLCEHLIVDIRPYVLSEYDVVAIEEELVWTLPVVMNYRLHIRVRPDLILRHKAGGQLVYYEWKTTSFTNVEQLKAYHDNPQIQIGMKAVEQKYGHCDWALVGMFYKGQKRQGVRSSPFCYGYVQGTKVATSYIKGWVKTPVVDILADQQWSMTDWMIRMSQEQVSGLFFTTDPIFTSHPIVDGISEQVPWLTPALLRADAGAYPQVFTQCVPTFGSSCGFYGGCHQTPTGDLPTHFEPRQPHHTPVPITLVRADGTFVLGKA